MRTLNLGAGINPTVCQHDGAVFVAFQADPLGPRPGWLKVWRYSPDLSQSVEIGELFIGTDASACPRFVTVNGELYVAHKVGGPNYELHVCPVFALSVTASPGANVVGHLAASADTLCWQEGQPGIVQKSIGLSLPQTVRQSDDSEGLWEIDPAGWPLLRYECRHARPELGTMATTAGPVTLAEDWRSGGGLEGRWEGFPDKALRLFPKQDTRDPHLSYLDGTLAVTTWGGGGMWLGLCTSADLVPLVPPEPPAMVPLPDGTVIEDTLPYVLSTRWPRVDVDGTGNMDCVPVDGQDAVAWVKFASPSFCEWWRWNSDYIYHHEDRSDGLDQPYHFKKDQWMRRRWAVGDEIDSREGNILYRTANNGQTWSEQPWAMVMRFVAAFDAYPCGGDIGDTPCIVVEYDPTYTLTPRRGGVERFWFALNFGWWRWQSAPFGFPFDFSTDPTDESLIDSKFHRLGGVRVTPIAPVRPWTEDPEEPPVPGKPYDEQFYLNTAPPMESGDATGAANQAIADYAKMNRPVDGQYSVWFTRTEHDYQNGMTLPASWKKHRNEMRALLDPSGQALPPFP